MGYVILDKINELEDNLKALRNEVEEEQKNSRSNNEFGLFLYSDLNKKQAIIIQKQHEIIKLICDNKLIPFLNENFHLKIPEK